MGHDFRQEFSVVAGLRPAKIVTAASLEELVSDAADRLHAVMARVRRDRRWFLRDKAGAQQASPFAIWEPVRCSDAWGSISTSIAL
jgi:hypothetical protein